MNVHRRKLLFANGVQTKMVNAIEATARYGYWWCYTYRLPQITNSLWILCRIISIFSIRHTARRCIRNYGEFGERYLFFFGGNGSNSLRHGFFTQEFWMLESIDFTHCFSLSLNQKNVINRMHNRLFNIELQELFNRLLALWLQEFVSVLTNH